MKGITTLVSAVAVIATSTAHAASLIVERTGSLNSGIYSVYLDGAPQNGNFNTIIFEAQPNNIQLDLINAGNLVQRLTYVPSLADPQMGPFANINSGLSSGVPLPPGQPATYFNRVLDADPLDVPQSLDWEILDLVRTPSELSFVGGPLGRQISTESQPGGRLFLANLYAPVPEPAGLLLLGSCVLAGVLHRRVTTCGERHHV